MDWIPVSERVPDHQDDVPVLINDFVGQRLGIAHRYGRGWFDNHGVKTVTHWLDVPKLAPKPRSCPFCGVEPHSCLYVLNSFHLVKCPCCGAKGPERATNALAIEAWNRRSAR